MDDSFSLDLAVDGATAVLAVGGEIDLHNAGELSALGLQALEQAEVATIVVDMTKLTFLDSTGVGALIQIREKAVEGGREMYLRNVPARVSRVLTITGLDATFDKRDSEAGA